MKGDWPVKDPPPCPSLYGGEYIAMSYELRAMSNELPTVILNSFQDLTESHHSSFSADRC